MDIIDFILYSMVAVCVIALIWCQIKLNQSKADAAARNADYVSKKMHLEIDRIFNKKMK